jgi:YidC/Oxa1 family membrane protein insertase
MTDQKNTLLAIVLSAVVLIVWQYFYGMPQMERQRQEAQQKQQQQQQQQMAPGRPAGAAAGQALPQAGQPGSPPAAASPSPRVAIDTPRLMGSIALRGGRIDDLALTTTARRRPEIAADRAAVALGQPAPVLRRVRLGRRRRHHR